MEDAIEELFDGVFHDHIATAGKTLLFASLTTMAYKRIARVVLDKGPLEYALDTHLKFGFERSIIATRTFQNQLKERLLSNDLLPIDAIKRSVHDAGLTSEQKVEKLTIVRKYSIAYILVTLRLKHLFLVTNCIRSTLLVLLFLEQKKAAQSTAAAAKSAWSMLSRLKQAGGGMSEGVVSSLVADMLSSTLQLDATPFENDGADGVGSSEHLADLILASVPQCVEAALMVTEATLSQVGEGISGKCDSRTLAIIFDLAIRTFREEPFWTTFSPLSSSSTATPPPPPGVEDATTKGGNGSNGPSRSTSSERLADAGGDGHHERAGNYELERQAIRASTPHVKHDLSPEVRSRLLGYLHDVTCASLEFDDLASAVTEQLMRQYAQKIVSDLEDQPFYKEGKCNTIRVVTRVEHWRLKVADDYLDVVPYPVQSFCTEMLRSSARVLLGME